ncbi:hypothetical protein HU200_048608 [Digitaria exilis]|uniref:Cytochrome P450 n=1 Tax=Digitaria exilis TaxID=1010633 RepID=A0A835EBV3_9POAL|nr:hypothetical protein HU200_048608 [Digitaria exilis]
MVMDQYTKLGSVFTISLFRVNITFLIGPEVSGHFYSGLDSEVSHNMMDFSVAMIGKEVGYALDATLRNEQQRFFSDALKPSKLRSHIGPMLHEVESYFAKWGQQGTVDLKHEFERLLVLISARCLIGKEVREKADDDFVTLFDELIENGVNLTSVLFPYAPTLANFRRDRARVKLVETLTEIVRSRKSSNQVERSSNQDEKDVLQKRIDCKYRDGRPTTESEVIGLITAFLLAGKHTSSTTSTWTGAHLLSNRMWLLAAIQEQKEIVRKHGYCVDYNVLQEMDILYCCIKEALRMHPSLVVNSRKVLKNFTVRCKEGVEYEIPKGHTIVSPILFNSNLPYIYKKPGMYDPDRFGPGREEDKLGGKFSYQAFGGGRHSCTGEAYAYMQIKVIWSHLLRNFELKLESPFPNTN